MRVLIVGLPLFAERLHKSLSEFDTSNTYYYLDTYYNKKDRLKALVLIPRVDVIYSINGTLDKSRVFDLALKLKKRVMMTWVGTDVTKAKNLIQINQRYLEKAEHYCEVTWIQKELKDLNIKADILNFFNFEIKNNSEQPSGSKLSVLSYISEGREKYYGWDEIMQAARENEDVNFTIVGTKGLQIVPDNVRCLGWAEDMNALFNSSHCTIRFVEHDGLSGFVLESLNRGKQVIYNQPLDHCIHVKNAGDISVAIATLKENYAKDGALLNQAGVDYVSKNFNRDYILNRLIKSFER